jgi:ribonuclease J
MDFSRPKEPLFIPLGGTGEIGMNLNVYGYRGRWLVVDCGVTFHREDAHRSRVHMPDPAFLEERQERVVGLVITHAHMDHLGAVADLWTRMKCPVYATPFAGFLLQERLREQGLAGRVPVRILSVGSVFEVGPFHLESISLTHSTIESTGLVLRFEGTTVLHTGDWKLDEEPIEGLAYDASRLQELGEEGVDVLIGDSTNATKTGHSPSEAVARDCLSETIQSAQGRVLVACFASNVARLRTVCELAEASGRRVALIGRSLYQIARAAKRAGYLGGLRKFIGVRDAGFLPPDEVLYIVTGSQGEPKAALSRIVTGQFTDFDMGDGDLVIFSSKVIPGNELAIQRMKVLLSERGVRWVDEFTHPEIHVSGHPYQEDLRRMYGWVRPRWVIPTHGEPRHLAAHAELARSLDGTSALQILNGQVVQLGPDGPLCLGRVDVGRLEREERGGGLSRVELSELGLAWMEQES